MDILNIIILRDGQCNLGGRGGLEGGGKVGRIMISVQFLFSWKIFGRNVLHVFFIHFLFLTS